jgi:hypothetical protein
VLPDRAGSWGWVELLATFIPTLVWVGDFRRGSISMARGRYDEWSIGVNSMAEPSRRLEPLARRIREAKTILCRSVIWWCRIWRVIFSDGRSLEAYVVLVTGVVGRSVWWRSARVWESTAPTITLVSACMVTSSVQSTSTWRSALSVPETAVGKDAHAQARRRRGPNPSSLVRPCFVRRRKPNRIRAAPFVVVWVQ